MRCTDMVGQRFRSYEGRVYLCVEYDPGHGFWMQNVDDALDRRDVSERAIYRTWHRVRMTTGAWRHLELYEQLGRTPTIDELVAQRLLYSLTTHTLNQNRLVDDAWELTERGHLALSRPERMMRADYLEF